LGFILGGFGGVINISGQVQTYMQLAAGIYMVLVAANLLDLHPIFRYVIFSPPKFLARLVKNQSRSETLFAPAILGAMTIFIPCGTTLAMEALAISSTSAISGALIMGSFTLGTMPLFFGIGVITSFLGESKRGLFNKIAAVLIIFLGLMSINGSLTALGIKRISVNSSPIVASGQTAQISITSSGYSPDYLQVRVGSPVTLKLIGQSNFSCASAFRIPSEGISVNLSPNETRTITFTPEKPGKIVFTCSMGMYSGVIEAI
jgi:sulfite exporter TauE/SafE